MTTGFVCFGCGDRLDGDPWGVEIWMGLHFAYCAACWPYDDDDDQAAEVVL